MHKARTAMWWYGARSFFAQLLILLIWAFFWTASLLAFGRLIRFETSFEVGDALRMLALVVIVNIIVLSTSAERIEDCDCDSGESAARLEECVESLAPKQAHKIRSVVTCALGASFVDTRSYHWVLGFHPQFIRNLDEARLRAAVAWELHHLRRFVPILRRLRYLQSLARNWVNRWFAMVLAAYVVLASGLERLDGPPSYRVIALAAFSWLVTQLTDPYLERFAYLQEQLACDAAACVRSGSVDVVKAAIMGMSSLDPTEAPIVVFNGQSVEFKPQMSPSLRRRLEQLESYTPA